MRIGHIAAACPGSKGGANKGPCPVTGALPPLSQPETTGQGCTCSGTCGATPDPTGINSRCDWCYTKDNCGTSGVTGHWDNCVYPAMKEFDAQDHKTKMDQIWANMTDPSVIGKSGPALSPVTAVADALSESMITTFDDEWEVMPKARSKVIHAQGVHCQFELNINAGGYTGILATGTQTGLIRMGSATTLDTNLPTPGGAPIFPGMGIKFFRSGVRSGSFVALRSTGPGGSFNFFDSMLSNHVAPLNVPPLIKKFQQASGCIDMVGLSDLCAHTQDGDKVAKPVFPFEIMFYPTGKVNFTNVKKSNAELLKELSGIPVGSEMFDVYTYASPKDKLAGNKVKIGTVTTSSACHQSLFGDQHLMIRHTRMEEDFALAPDWIPQMAGLKDSACTASAKPISTWQCVAAPQWANATK